MFSAYNRTFCYIWLIKIVFSEMQFKRITLHKQMDQINVVLYARQELVGIGNNIRCIADFSSQLQS